ncbi:hypothetical protein CIRMBP1320_01095 [Enterococcus cecorum]|nr:hypothetical protein [Enterococcus cecorum]CAI3418664.1 hypothetical protein CIRMBP1320_01095 [Enterococcus cecorum]
MENKQIAATVILHRNDGSKRFLTENQAQGQSLLLVENDTMHTGLANVLQNIKENVHLDVFQLRLVELTNAKIADKRMPIFVFEVKEEDIDIRLPAQYSWKEAKYFMQMISEFELQGMPIF